MSNQNLNQIVRGSIWNYACSHRGPFRGGRRLKSKSYCPPQKLDEQRSLAMVCCCPSCATLPQPLCSIR